MTDETEAARHASLYERIAVLESQEKRAREEARELRRDNESLRKVNCSLQRDFEDYRGRWMQRGKALSDTRSYNAKLKELARFLYGELVKDVTLVDVDGNESIAPWGEEYMEPIIERMAALGIEVEGVRR